MKSLSATMPTDEKWATRLEKLLAGGFSETVLEATVRAADGQEMYKCSGVLEVEKGDWLLRLFRRKKKLGLGYTWADMVPDAVVHDREDCLSVILQFPDHTEAVLEEVWPGQSGESVSDSWYHETRHRAGVLTTPLVENPAYSLAPNGKWTESRVHGFVPGVKLPYTMRGGVKSTLELPLIGKRTYSRAVWADKRPGCEWLAVDDDKGLAVYLKDDAGLSEKEARENFNALILALGFVMGRQLRYCYAAVDWCGKEQNGRELAPPEGPGGTILLPVDPQFASANPGWTNDLVWAAYDFLKNQDHPIARLVMNSMLQVYRSVHPAVPTDTKMLMLCTRIEKLVKVMAAASKFEHAPHQKRKRQKHLKGTDAVKRRALWRHVAELFDISWDKGLKPVHYSWEQCRHKLAHGNPEVFVSMRSDDAFRHMFRLEGGFNALLAGIFRCHTNIRISPMEPKLSANIRLTISVMNNQEWERRIVTALNAVTLKMAGYAEDSES